MVIIEEQGQDIAKDIVARAFRYRCYDHMIDFRLRGLKQWLQCI